MSPPPPGFLARFLGHDRSRRALRDPEGVWLTYGDLRERGERAAAWLSAEGVRPGHVVAIHLENSLALVDVHLGCLALGAVRLPLNAHYREAELAPILEDAAPQLVLTRSPERFGALRCFPAPVLDQTAGTVGLSVWPQHELTALLFTSGTTGRPKGVPQTFSMWESNLDALSSLWGLSDDDCLWLALPLFHTHGLVLGLHGTLLRGACAVLMPRFDPVELPVEVTHVYGVPTWYRRWLPLMREKPEGFRRLTLLVSGSDGLDAATSDAVFEATGHRILERYGMTETLMICSNPGAGERRAGTVGPPVPGVDVRIVDGEVQVRGPSVFTGYWSLGPERSGWFPTGDAGEWDAAGYLRIVGRKKELIIVGGVNVSPLEVEAAFADVEGVHELGVCGLPDPDLTEVVALAIVPASGAVEVEILAGIAARSTLLSGLKRPRRVVILTSLPRNALGKLQRSALRKQLEESP
ncbi:MAG: hypothetical protein EXR69_02265 [Myxococcales bacterium]|nr:hypothetical protein [Myxococcales bacterium]